MKIFNKSKNTIIAQNVFLADTFWTRMKGLLGSEEIAAGEALVITNCQSIHMFFMRFAIDAIFVDDQDRVVGLAGSIKPFYLSPVFFRSKYVIELKSGTIAATKTSLQDQLEWRKSTSEDVGWSPLPQGAYRPRAWRSGGRKRQ
ncbi:MAG: DUF192 domain-containing protein [Candidatus Omnitrophica bacterium]|nr:DUF192 domain-containing protein [Candidatus Omnitrophota bacterium]